MIVCRNRKCVVVNPRTIRYYLALQMMQVRRKKAREQLKFYLAFKEREKNFFRMKVLPTHKKFLVIIACHCDCDRKMNTIQNNLQYFLFHTVEVVIVNSAGLPQNSHLQTFCSQYPSVHYMETANAVTLDYGKWIEVLTSRPTFSADFVVLTNDSYFMHENIHHFFHLAIQKNVQLFAYNDSLQMRYHFQSYLFVLRRDAVSTFVQRVRQKEANIHSYNDVILLYELNMRHWFQSKDVYLKIAGSTRGANIFFNSPQLYQKLKESQLLPFTKLKAVSDANFPPKPSSTNQYNSYSYYTNAIRLSNRVQVVCARYNENVEWLIPIVHNCIVYNKGEDNLFYLPSNQIVKCENIGREGHTYVKYIIDHYEHLAEYIFFTQGSPTEHLYHTDETQSYREIYDALQTNVATSASFRYLSKWLVKVHDFECFDYTSGLPSLRIPLFFPQKKRVILDFLEPLANEPGIRALMQEVSSSARKKEDEHIWIYELTEYIERNAFFMDSERGQQMRSALFRLFEIDPKYEQKLKGSYAYGSGAIFVVKRQQILKHPLEFWKNIEQCLQTNRPSAGYGLEKMWALLLE
jgi:hypothetical protein